LQLDESFSIFNHKKSHFSHTFAQLLRNGTQTSNPYISARIRLGADWNRFLDSWDQDGSSEWSYEKLWIKTQFNM